MISNEKLLELAWQGREYAKPSGKVKVGCAIENEQGEIFTGWNVGGAWGNGVHAEICAIVQMVKSKSKGIKIAIVSETEYFTPCGNCRDWLMKYCSKDSPVIIQNHKQETHTFVLKDLCPEFPKL